MTSRVACRNCGNEDWYVGDLRFVPEGEFDFIMREIHVRERDYYAWGNQGDGVPGYRGYWTTCEKCEKCRGG